MTDIIAAEQAAGLLISAARQINAPERWTQNNATNAITWRTLDALSLALRSDDIRLHHPSEQKKPL